MPCETVEVTTEGTALDTWTHLICGSCRSTYKTLILYALLPAHYKHTAFLCGPEVSELPLGTEEHMVCHPCVQGNPCP